MAGHQAVHQAVEHREQPVEVGIGMTGACRCGVGSQVLWLLRTIRQGLTISEVREMCSRTFGPSARWASPTRTDARRRRRASPPASSRRRCFISAALSGRPGPGTTMTSPIDAPTSTMPADVTTGRRISVSSRSPSRTADSGSKVPAKKPPNSSPPGRATASPVRAWLLRRRPISARTSSPIAWPRSGSLLIGPNLSRSIATSTPPRASPWRVRPIAPSRKLLEPPKTGQAGQGIRSLGIDRPQQQGDQGEDQRRPPADRRVGDGEHPGEDDLRDGQPSDEPDEDLDQASGGQALSEHDRAGRRERQDRGKDQGPAGDGDQARDAFRHGGREEGPLQ